MTHASPFSTSMLRFLSNDIKNAPMRGVLTPIIELWSFESPNGLPSPHFGSVSLILTLSQSRVATYLAIKWGCDNKLWQLITSEVKSFQVLIFYFKLTLKSSRLMTSSPSSITIIIGLLCIYIHIGIHCYGFNSIIGLQLTFKPWINHILKALWVQVSPPIIGCH
jgi:hypothetical protein